MSAHNKRAGSALRIRRPMLAVAIAIAMILVLSVFVRAEIESTYQMPQGLLDVTPDSWVLSGSAVETSADPALTVRRVVGTLINASEEIGVPMDGAWDGTAFRTDYSEVTVWSGDQKFVEWALAGPSADFLRAGHVYMFYGWAEDSNGDMWTSWGPPAFEIPLAPEKDGLSLCKELKPEQVVFSAPDGSFKFQYANEQGVRVCITAPDLGTKAKVELSPFSRNRALRMVPGAQDGCAVYVSEKYECNDRDELLVKCNGIEIASKEVMILVPTGASANKIDSDPRTTSGPTYSTADNFEVTWQGDAEMDLSGVRIFKRVSLGPPTGTTTRRCTFEKSRINVGFTDKPMSYPKRYHDTLGYSKLSKNLKLPPLFGDLLKLDQVSDCGNNVEETLRVGSDSATGCQLTHVNKLTLGPTTGWGWGGTGALNTEWGNTFTTNRQ